MSRAPRVLVAGAVLGQPMGGVRRHNAELLPRAARLLAADGGGLAVLVGRQKLAFDLPPEVERISSDVPAGPPLKRARAEGPAIAGALQDARAAGRPFDLVHTAHLPVPRRLDVPFTLTLHDLRAMRQRTARFVRRFLGGRVIGDAVRRAARVLCVSESVRAEIGARFEVPLESIAVVPNAADHLPLLPRAPGPGAALLHVGHLEPRKNLILLLEALALDPSLPPLELVGAPKGATEDRLRARAAELGVAERVRFLGARPDAELPRLYAECAAVCLPSRIEGFGIPALEAQRAGAPLAIARGSALTEVAGDEVPSFDPDDAAECARSLRAALARSQAELERDAHRANRFRWDRSAELLVEAWRA